MATEPLQALLTRAARREASELVNTLATCGTEADVVQVLYAAMRPRYGYDIVVLQVLEQEGWFHRIVVDKGVLQDVRRFRLEESYFAEHFRRGRAVPGHFVDAEVERGRGTGGPRAPSAYVWVPISHQGKVVASVVYQLYEPRPIPPEEVAFLEAAHSGLGVVVTNAYLNELTRGQSLRLTALNDIGRALSGTRREEDVLSALNHTLRTRVPIDILELVVPAEGGASQARLVRIASDDLVERREVSLDDPGLASARTVLRGSGPVVSDAAGSSEVWLPVLRPAGIDAVLALRTSVPEAYEESTVTFLEQVADQVGLALRNAWSYSNESAQRRRLEVVEAVGRQLASSLDRPSIMRTLRIELARHLRFDVFCLAILEDTPSGPVAHGYVYDSGQEQPLISVPLLEAGPSREAYETGRPVLVRRTAWSGSVRAGSGQPGDLVDIGGAIVQVSRGAGLAGQRVSRSMVWVPVPHGGRIRALLSLQSYRPDAFDDWHVRVLQDVAAHVSLALATADLVTELNRQTGELDRQARTMSAILDHAPIGVVLEDGEGEVVFANPAFERIYGAPARQAGLAAAELFAQLPPAEAGTDGAGSVEVHLPDGGTTVEVRRILVPGTADRPPSTLTLHEDVTRERAVQAAKELMLRAIGHEVRSPAAAMRATMAGLVQWSATIDTAQRELLVAEAYEQSERLLRLVEAQLIIAKLEMREFEPSPVPVQVVQTLERTIALLGHRYGERTGLVHSGLPAGLPAAYCEPTHLDQVLTNLVINALEHARPTRIDVSARCRDRWLEVTVADDGVGVGPEHRGGLFSQSAPAGRHRAQGGLGMGLYLCRLIVERSFGGRIWLRRRRRPGTAISFTVPAA